PENTNDKGNGEENLGTNAGREEGHDEEEEEDELYRDVNINLGRGIQTTQEFTDSHVTLTPINANGQQQSSFVSSQFMTSILNPTPDAGMESIFETTSQMDVQTPTLVAPLFMSAPTFTPSTIATITTTLQAPTPSTTAPSTRLEDLPVFGSLFGFDNRLKTLEANFFKFMQTNQFAGAVSSIPGIAQRYMDQRMNDAVKIVVQIQSDRLHDEAQAKNDEFLKTIDENMQKIIKEQVKEQVKVQVSKILPKIEHFVNEKLEAEVLTRSSNSSKTSYAVAADLSKMELKNILIEKMEGNKSIQRYNEQRNLYKALVEAYEFDKIILDTYGDTVMLKRRRDDDVDKDEEPSVRSDRGSKRRREGNEPDSTTFEMEEPLHLEFETGANDQPIIEPSQQPEWFSQQKKPPTLDRDWNKTLLATHKSIQPLVELKFSLEEVYKATTDQLDWVNPKGQQYPHNPLKPLPLIRNNRGHRVIPFNLFINNDLEYLCGGASSLKYTTSITKTKAAYYGHIKWIKDLVPRTMWIQEPIGYDKHSLWGISIVAVTELKIVEWHSYKNLDWITVRKNNDKLYKFNEGDFKRLRMRVEDLQLGVESYQKKLNLTKLDMYRSDLKCKEAYIADGMLTDVRTTIDDRLKEMRMKYLPHSI
nr:hypothetical protein [Tanacetum cinerariifolium]